MKACAPASGGRGPALVTDVVGECFDHPQITRLQGLIALGVQKRTQGC